MKHNISLSMFSYKPRLIGEGRFSLRVAYQLKYGSQIQIMSFTNKLRGFLPGTYGSQSLYMPNDHVVCLPCLFRVHSDIIKK